MLLDGIIVANPEQAGPFPRTKTQIVQNFPTLTEMVPSPDLPYESRKRRAVYVGRLSETRGIRQMVAAAGLVKDPEFRLVLGGKFVPDAIKEDVADDPGWEKVEYLGEIDRKTLVKVYNESRLGLVVMHPTPSFLSNQPVKLFEHMLARLPSVVSDFTNYRKYVAEIDAGLVVNPLDPSQIADAIQWLLDHPEDAQRMGHNGQKAIIENYNWEAEAEKMVKFYRTVVLT